MVWYLSEEQMRRSLVSAFVNGLRNRVFERERRHVFSLSQLLFCKTSTHFLSDGAAIDRVAKGDTIACSVSANCCLLLSSLLSSSFFSRSERRSRPEFARRDDSDGKTISKLYMQASRRKRNVSQRVPRCSKASPSGTFLREDVGHDVPQQLTRSEGK